MSAAVQSMTPDLRSELLNWRERLRAASTSSESVPLDGLLREVSAAIDRLTEPESYGVCQVCHDLIGQAAMNADPLAKTCLSCLTPVQLAELEDDLDRAWLIQGELLPKQNFNFNGWEVSYHYKPAGRVSGDYCDIVTLNTGDMYFLIGDVSGKGVAASLLMSRLHAIFRSLISLEIGVSELVARANRLFIETTMRPYYATLVCGKANSDGRVEVCNAGHCPPLFMTATGVSPIGATGLPLGMFGDQSYESLPLEMSNGDRLVLYTDGLSEARDGADIEYGSARLHSLLGECSQLHAPAVVNRLLQDVDAFSLGAPLADDLTIMAIEMAGH